MKVCIVQPPYSTDYSKSETLFQWMMDALDRCDSSMDLIVFPECCDVPAKAGPKEQYYGSVEKYNQVFLEKAMATAKRCSAVLFFNGVHYTENGPRNTTHAINKNGEIAGYYYKQHLVLREMTEWELDSDYSLEFSEPTILEIDGIRYAFLTCYDFYFYEAFSNMARYAPDIVIGCSHQRSDTHLALELFSQTCAYNCNAYVVRSSVSMGEDSLTGGASMVVAPTGEILAQMESRIGMECVEIDPHKKYNKPMGFGNPDGPHYRYIEQGRRPWKYRPAGSAIVRYDDIMPYPRVCAHRGFNTVAPENSMPAFGAAIAMGAEEIELDLWATTDGVIVSCHDPVLDRVSDGHGNIWEHSYADLLQYDFGFKYSEEFRGLRIPTFEDVLKRFACHTVMNVHIKSQDNANPLPEETLREIIRLINKYDCRRYVYFMSGNYAILKQLATLAPDIARCVGASDDPFEDLVEVALNVGAKKIQLYKPHFAENGPAYVADAIKKAHAHNIICNVFFADDPQEAREYLELGADVILTNDYNRIAQEVRDFANKRETE